MSRRFGGAALLVLALAPGCRQGDAGGKSGARLEVRWAGADSARFGAPATAEWCDSLDLLEIRAAAGDTGIELALYRRGGIVPGRARPRGRQRPPADPAAREARAAVYLISRASQARQSRLRKYASTYLARSVTL